MPAVMPKHYLKISTEFSRTPGPRNPSEGEFSGELFLDTILEKRFQNAVTDKQPLIVDLDGTEGYATSFLEASFGGLARKHDINLVLSTLQFITTEEPYLEDEIKSYIREARDQ